MLRAINVLTSMRTATAEADGYEVKYGARGRALVLITLPAKTVLIYLVAQVLGRLVGRLGRAMGRPVSPASERVAALWVGALAANRLPSLLLPTSHGVCPEDRVALAMPGTMGGANAAALAASLDEAQMRAALAHQIAHLRLGHIVLISFATAAMAAGMPLLLRRLAAAEACRGLDEAQDEPDFVLSHRGGTPSWDLLTSRKIAAIKMRADHRYQAATVIAILSGSLAVAAVSRACELSADRAAAGDTSPQDLAGAIEAVDAAGVAYDSRPGPKAVFWKAEHAIGRTPPVRLFSPVPSTQTRLSRLRKIG